MSFRYGRSALLGEALRAGAGLAAVALVMIAASAPYLIWASIVLFVLFAGYLASVGLKLLTSLTADDEGLALSRKTLFAASRALPWREISAIRLDFFPFGRDRAKGHFRLTAKSARTRIAFDSSLDGFAKLVREIVRRTEGRAELSPVTRHNLGALEREAQSP